MSPSASFSHVAFIACVSTSIHWTQVSFSPHLPASVESGQARLNFYEFLPDSREERVQLLDSNNRVPIIQHVGNPAFSLPKRLSFRLSTHPVKAQSEGNQGKMMKSLYIGHGPVVLGGRHCLDPCSATMQCTG